MVRLPLALIGSAVCLASLLGAPAPAEAQSIGRSYQSGSTTSGRRSFRVTSPGRTSGRRSFRTTNGRVTWSPPRRSYTSGQRRFQSGQRRFQSGQRRYTSGQRRFQSGQRTFQTGRRRYDQVVVGRNRNGRTVVFRGGPRANRTGRARTRRHRALVSGRHLAPRRRTYVYLDPYYGPNYPQFPYGTRFYRYVNGRLVVFDGPDHTVPSTIYYDPAYAEPAPGLPNKPPLNNRIRIVEEPRSTVVPQPRPKTKPTKKRPSLGARFAVALEVKDWKTLLRMAKWTKNDPDRERTLRLAIFAQFPSPTVLREAAKGLEARKDQPGAASLLRVLRGSAAPAAKRGEPKR